jgi:MFS family permease
LLARLGGRLADKWGALRTALYAIFILAPIVAGYGLAATPLAIIIVSVVEGVVQAATIPASQASMSQVAPEGRAAAAQGLSGAANLVGAAATAFVSPWIYGAHGPVWAFGVIAAAMLSFSLVAQTMARRYKLI